MMYRKSLSCLLTIFMVLLLTIVAPLSAESISPVEFYVDALNGDDTNEGSLASPFATLEKAITEAPTTNETIIYLKAGDYLTTSTITHQSLTITAYCNEQGSFDTVNIFPNYENSEETPFGLWTANWIFNIPSLPTKVDLTLSHVNLSGDNATTVDTVEDGNTVTGIYLYSVDGAGSQVTVSNCTLETMASGIDSQYSDTITITLQNSKIVAERPVSMQYGARINVYNSTLQMTSPHSSNSVIDLNGNIHADIIGNNIIGNQGIGRGIYDDVVSGTIRNNTFVDLDIALELNTISNLMVADNYVETTKSGFDLETEYSAATISVTGNTIIQKGAKTNGKVGLYLYSDSYTTSGTYTVTNNEIVNFDYGFHYYGNNTTPVMDVSFGGASLGNIFRGNTINLYIEDLRTAAPIDVRGTDWGTLDMEEIKSRMYIEYIYTSSDATTAAQAIEEAFIYDDSISTQAPSLVYVDNDYTLDNAGDHTYGRDAFSSLQEALPYVITGGTVYVADGSYNGTIWLERSVNLIGTGSNVILLPAENDDYYNKIVQITGEYITIDNFTFNGGKFGIYFNESPYSLRNFSSHNKNFTVKDCEFINQAFHAINSMNYLDTIYPGEIKIINNSFSNDNNSNSTPSVYVKSSAEQLTFSNNYLEGTYSNGIELYSYSDLTVEGNHILPTVGEYLWNNFTALSTSSSGNLVVQDNVVQCMDSYQANGNTVGVRISMLTSPPSSEVPALKQVYRNVITGFNYGISLYGEETSELFDVVIGGSDSNANSFGGNMIGLVSFLNNFNLEPTNATHNIWGIESNILNNYILSYSNNPTYSRVNYLPVASTTPKLSNLILSAGTLSPEFSSSTYEYEVSVDYETSAILLSPTASAGTILVNDTAVASETSQEINLAVGLNTFTIEVKSGDLSSLYTLVITRSDAPPTQGGNSYIPPTLVVTTTKKGNSTITNTKIPATTYLGCASANISSSIIDALLNKARTSSGISKDDVIEVTIDTLDHPEKLQVSVPRSGLGKIVSDTDSSYTITSSLISITFDHKALETIADAGVGSTVVISAGILDNSTLSETDRIKVANRPVYDLTVKNGEVEVSHFGGGHATVSIPYTLTQEENPNAVIVYYLSDDGNLRTVRGHYDTDSQAVVFKTSHFSKFVIGYNTIGFADVVTGAWYQNAVEFIAARGITSGTGDNQFSPDAKLTRAQLVVLLMNSYQINTQNKGEFDHIENFTDAGNTYYTNYLLAAKGLGIVNGIGNNLFAPDKEITRQEMIVMLYNVLTVINEVPSFTVNKQLESFSDANQVAPWANDALSALVKGGAIGGSYNNLNPTDTTTRAEIAQVLYNLLSQ